MTRVFIDGSAGTTGLRIHSRLSERRDLELIALSEAQRKDGACRRDAINDCDVAILCLPDAAAREAVGMIENPAVRVIDTSTAHRVAPGWDYGFAELCPERREAIAASRRVANPGCHASGFIASVYPLVRRGLLSRDTPLTAYSLTGYSGGGKALIAEYEDKDRDPRHGSHRIYSTALAHKHLPEMQQLCGLRLPPLFSPVLGDFYAGMATTVMLPGQNAGRVHAALAEHYAGQALVTVAPPGGDEPVIYADTMAGRDSLRLIVCGHRSQATVTALFDNLGKGASGAAVQNLNIMLGLDETIGLVL